MCKKTRLKVVKKIIPGDSIVTGASSDEGCGDASRSWGSADNDPDESGERGAAQLHAAQPES